MKQLSVFALGLISCLLALPVFAAESQFQVGKDYEVMVAKSATEPMVEEYFNYACGACYAAEKFNSDFKAKHKNIKFSYIPVELRPSWSIYVDAYYIGEKLGVLDKSHPKLFDRLHIEKKFFKGEDDMKAFFLELGVAEADYDKVAKSYWLKTQKRQAKQLVTKFRAFTTPTYVVNRSVKLNRTELGTYDRIENAIVEFSGANK